MFATAVYKYVIMRFGMVLIAVVAASAIDAQPDVTGFERLAHALVSRATQPPDGWVDFCARQPGECAGTTPAPRDHVLLRREAWADLERINKLVNQTIKPLIDLEHWGVVEHWSYPDDGYGDCEDYVLLKRRMLMHAGWPREALLVTVVRNKKDEGHAVLTVGTNKGDYILDNETEHILLWSETGYHFIKRQSQSNPNEWVSLRNPQPVIARSFAPDQAPYLFRRFGTKTSR
jgi:predicted transglutaminase-like cysteine proteinase